MFNEYWKTKAAKQRKKWAAKAKRFAERHAQLEEIRREVFLPLDYTPNFDFGNYKLWHFVKQNPIAQWKGMGFCFSESGLREALAAEGADLNLLEMQVSRPNIKGQEAPQPRNRWKELGLDCPPNRAFDEESRYHAWLRRIYDICTEVETVRLTYRQVTMTIKRYSMEGVPFGFYELNPCEQLTKAPMLMEETDFNVLNVATLLMEMAAEWELRQEELNYHAKQLKLRTMVAAISDDHIAFTLWDDKKLEQKIPEYVAKDYSLEKIANQVLRPWKSAVEKCFETATERTLKEQVQKLTHFCSANSQNVNRVMEQELRPYLESVGLHDVALKSRGTIITLTYQDCQCSMRAGHSIVFCPNTHWEEICINLRTDTPMSIIGEYLKQMPAINSRVDDCLVKMINLYHHHLLRNDEQRSAVQHLDGLAAQYAGKPVGKMMKFLRCNVDSLMANGAYFKLSILSITITGDNSFCFVEKSAYRGGNVYQQEQSNEVWVDDDCHYIYTNDPTTTDEESWKRESKEHQDSPLQKWKWWRQSARGFVGHYSPYSASIIWGTERSVYCRVEGIEG